MPSLTAEETKILIEEIKNALPVTVRYSEQKKELSLKECDEYLNNKNKKVEDMTPLSVYYIISKLNETDQIEFIKNNINYIKKYDEEIFLYNMLSPYSLSHYLSFNVLKEIKKIDKEIFQKIIDGSYENLFNGFSFNEFINFFNEFYEEINNMKNWNFINSLYSYNHGIFNDVRINYRDSAEAYTVYNKQIVDVILKKYNEKIKTFTSAEFMNFIHFIKDIKQFENTIIENKKKIVEIIKNPELYELYEFFDMCTAEETEFILLNFFDDLVENSYKVEYSNMVENFFAGIDTNVIIKIYKQNRKLSLSLNQLIKSSSKYNVFNEDLKKILDEYKIENLDSIENLFDTNFYTNVFRNESLKALEYVEKKFRNNIEINGILEELEEESSIFSSKYFKNLKELKCLLKNNYITIYDVNYQKHFKQFVLYLKSRDVIANLEDESIKEIEKLFYKIVKGDSITILYKIKNINDIVLYNRIGDINFSTLNLTLDQIKRYNVKNHKKLYGICESGLFNSAYKSLTLKIMLLVGYNNAKKILNIDSSMNVLEHLVGNVDVKTIKIDESGNPILNERIINLLFNNKNKYLIKEMLENKESELYKYFPRIFSEWELIKANQKDKSLDTILEYLKSDTISIPPEYNRLSGLFKYIGCSNSIVNETFSLHDQMLNRTESTIPKVLGHVDEYSYEILDLQDMEGLVVGNKTDCCFTVLGNGYSCLKHACTSKNGRILVIKKNDELVAHSWIWRNGDLLCLDNIEISKSIKEVNFLDVYLRFADEIINKSFENEGYDKCIKNITIGYTSFDKPNEKLKQYPCLISRVCDSEKKDFVQRLGDKRMVVNSLPGPIEEVTYSDSKNVQYLIKGNGIFNLGQSTHLYKDKEREKNKVLTLNKGTI